MSPILELIGGAKSYGWGKVELSTTAFESIATPAISGSSSFVEFTSIPQTYKHLQIRYSVITNATNADITLTVNGVASAGSYTYHELRGTGSGTAVANGNNNMGFYYIATNATDGTWPAIGISDIFDYSDTNKITTIRSLSGKDTNGSGTLQILTGMNKVTTAVTSIKFDCNSTIATNSKIALYGIKG
jgi:hypothetical protein